MTHLCYNQVTNIPGGGREALWPSGQYAAVDRELWEGFLTARVLIPAVGDITEILDSSFSVAFITSAVSAVPPGITQEPATVS